MIACLSAKHCLLALPRLPGWLVDSAAEAAAAAAETIDGHWKEHHSWWVRNAAAAADGDGGLRCCGGGGRWHRLLYVHSGKKSKGKRKKRKKKRTGNRTAKQVSVAVFAGSIAAQFNRFDTLHLLRLLLLPQTMVVVVAVRQWCHWCWTSISSFLLLRVWLYSNGFIWIALSSTDLLPTISICCQLVRVQFSARFSVSKRSLIESAAGVGSS